MSPSYSSDVLKDYARRVEAIADIVGLTHIPQEFILATEGQVKQLLAYDGILPRYRHWSFGKAYDRIDTLYRFEVTPMLPYELVINSNPSRAWLLGGNSLVTQILVMAHVFAHNNFFASNYLFKATDPHTVHDRFREDAETVGRLIQEVGEDAVEDYLTAAHSVREQRVFIPGVEGHFVGYNLLRYIAAVHPALEDWQREILAIVDRAWEYFVPQVETKIMNEGWAAWWHRAIVEKLDLPPGLHIEFLDLHTNVVDAMAPGGINPYFIGSKVFEDIRRRWDRMSRGDVREGEKWDGLSGIEKMFEVMRTTKDADFLAMYLTEELIEECHLVEFRVLNKQDIEVTETGEGEGWKRIRDTLVSQTGANTFPAVHAVDPDWRGRGELYLKHEDDGRNLHPQYTEGTLRSLYHLWGKPVHLETITYRQRKPYRYTYTGFTHTRGRVQDLPPPTPGKPSSDVNWDQLRGFIGSL